MSVPAFERTARGRIIYAAHVADRARELYEAEWPKKRIARLVAQEFGLPAPPTPNTITAWVEPAKAQRWSDDARRRRRATIRRSTLSVVQGAERSEDWKLDRMRALANAGVSCAAIAKVMALDFPNDPVLTEHQVRHILARGAMPRTPTTTRRAA